MAEQPGDSIKIRILLPGGGASNVYKTAHTDWKEQGGAGNIGNSEVEGFELRLGVKKVLMATITNASYDPASNMFQAPLNIRALSTIGLVIYPAGLDEDAIYCPFFLVENVSGNADSNSSEGLHPISFDGHSQGQYFMPGDDEF